MTWPNEQSNPAGAIPVYLTGGAVIVPTPPVAFPATIVAGATFNTGIMPTLGCKGLAASAELTQTGVLSIQRYIDLAGTIPIGAAITQAMSAATLATVSVNDGLPAASWQVSIQNTSGALGTLTNAALLQTGT